MAKQNASAWTALPAGAALSLGLYTALQGLLALLAIRAILPETAVFQLQAVCAAAASAAGGCFAARRAGLGTLWAALGTAGVFALSLLLGGFLACGGIVWSQKTAVLLACVSAGGILAGVLGGGTKKKRRSSAGRGERRKRKPL